MGFRLSTSLIPRTLVYIRTVETGCVVFLKKSDKFRDVDIQVYSSALASEESMNVDTERSLTPNRHLSIGPNAMCIVKLGLNKLQTQKGNAYTP